MPDRRYTYQVDIDVAQARQAAQQLRGIFESELRTVNAGTGATSTVRGVGGASSMLGGLLGASLAGLGAGMAAGALVRTAKELAELNRQSRMAEQGLVHLAGSAEEAAERTALVQAATGNTISKIEAMQQATQLTALGFADTTAEMERFIRASQGASAATGRTVDYITQQLVLAISNQSLMRLDQLGLSVSEVKGRIEDLKLANADWSQEMVYQEAVVGLLEQKYGALADTVKTNASGFLQLSAAWTDYKTSVSDASLVADKAASTLAAGLRKLTLSGEAFRSMWPTIWDEMTEGIGTTDEGIIALAQDVARLRVQFVFGATDAETLLAAIGRLREATDAYSAAPYYPTREDGATAGPAAVRLPETWREGPRDINTEEGYADFYSRVTAERDAARAKEDQWYRDFYATVTEGRSRDERRAQDLYNEQLRQADAIGAAWKGAAKTVVDEFKGRLNQVPGLTGTSPVTSEQMALADYGVPQNFADNWLRRIEDEMLNGKDWGLGGSAAARAALGRIGRDTSGIADEGVLALLRQSWDTSALFANPENLGLIDQAAVQESLRSQELAQQGQENILAYFGMQDNPQAVERLQTYGVEAAGEFGIGIIQQMPSVATQAAESLAANMNSIFSQAVGKYSWLDPLTDAIAAEVLAMINEGQEDDGL